MNNKNFQIIEYENKYIINKEEDDENYPYTISYIKVSIKK